MFERKSGIFLFYVILNVGILCLIFLHAPFKQNEALPFLKDRMELVRRLELTDLCLFTDAQYTRHPSMADMTTPFQEHPLSLEHFPSGSLLEPPLHLRFHELAR
jgi:hypothetical protein